MSEFRVRAKKIARFVAVWLTGMPCYLKLEFDFEFLIGQERDNFLAGVVFLSAAYIGVISTTVNLGLVRWSNVFKLVLWH
jgi:hypothetical protein